MGSWLQVTENSTQTFLSTSGNSLVHITLKPYCRLGFRQAVVLSQVVRTQSHPPPPWLCPGSTLIQVLSWWWDSHQDLMKKRSSVPNCSYKSPQLNLLRLHLAPMFPSEPVQWSDRLLLAGVSQPKLPRPRVGKSISHRKKWILLPGDWFLENKFVRYWNQFIFSDFPPMSPPFLFP